MVLIIVVLLLCGRAAESKIVYMRPTTTAAARNDTTTMATTTTTTADVKNDDDKDGDKDDNDKDGGTTTGGRYAADTDKSMSTKTDVVGVQFYAPPVIHGTAGDAFGRQVRPHYHRQREPPHQPPAYPHHRHVHHYLATPWDEPGANADGGPILMSPLSYAQQPVAAQPRQTARGHVQRTRPMAARVVEYADPAAASLAFLAAETDDTALLDNLPVLRLALRHATTGDGGNAAVTAHPVPSVQPHQLHQLVQQQRASSHRPPHHQHRIHGPHHRYAAAGPYTQVPFLYNLPAPPVQRNLAPAEYDLVTRFNRLLLRQRVRPVADDVAEDHDEGTTARPVTKPKKKTTTGNKKKRKKKKKKTTTTTTTTRPAPVEEEQQEEEDDGEQQHQEQDERAEDEQPASEEQESQNVATSQQFPEDTAIHESEVDFPNEMDNPSRLSEQFGGDLTFEDGNGERVEFQLHGLGGPESYKFGFDTGKGTNRQFRYEERDSTGNVHGHYGYLDNEGKMQVYNYSSHPELGFHSQKSEALEM